MAGSASTLHQRARSVVFDIELDGLDGSGFTASDVLHELLTQCGQQSSQEQAKLTNDAQQAHVLAISPSGEVNLERFAQLLAMRGYHVWLRTGRLDCCCGQVALRHTFVLAGVSGSTGADLMPQLFVVDPSFKEQFQLPNATPEYSALFQELPNLFVGTAEQLVPVVELMCTQMQQVFADTATSCPPWRTPSCMLTKWLPTAADDVPVAAPGSSDGDSSSAAGSANSSALSSPAGLRLSSSTGPALLAPIRTAGLYAGDAADGPAGRSPLYFDQEKFSTAKAFLAPSSPDELEDEAGQRGFGPADARQSLFVHWAADDTTGTDLPAGRVVSDTCFMGSGSSWGFRQFGSTVSSPGVDVIWGSLRHCQSEDGSGAMPGRSRARSVAIAARSSTRIDQGAGNGFADALTGRADLAQLRDLSPDAPLPARSISAIVGGHSSSSAGRSGAGSGFFGAYRSQVVAGNPTLDISRFDRNSFEDVPAGPLAWGLGADRFGGASALASARKLGHSVSAGSSKPPACAGAMCAPVRRRSTTGSTSSQCSALSAAIAGGKGLPLR